MKQLFIDIKNAFKSWKGIKQLLSYDFLWIILGLVGTVLFLILRDLCWDSGWYDASDVSFYCSLPFIGLLVISGLKLIIAAVVNLFKK